MQTIAATVLGGVFLARQVVNSKEARGIHRERREKCELFISLQCGPWYIVRGPEVTLNHKPGVRTSKAITWVSFCQTPGPISVPVGDDFAVG